MLQDWNAQVPSRGILCMAIDFKLNRNEDAQGTGTYFKIGPNFTDLPLYYISNP